MKVESFFQPAAAKDYSGVFRVKQQDLQQQIKIQNDVFGVADPEKDKTSVKVKAVSEAINKANNALNISGRRLEFSIHKGTKEIMVKVLNSETGEVIREIPSEKMLDIAADMRRAAGILVDKKI